MGDFPAELTSIDELRKHYRQPSRIVVEKTTDVLDEGCREFIAAATLVMVGTADAEGNQDVSPRGGLPGFVRVLDDKRLVIPDLNGNNRLDSLQNVIVNPRVGLLFLVPGLGETLRLNGRAIVTVDDAILDGFTDQFRRPASALGVTVDEAYIHCAKSLRRANLWQADHWPDGTARPSVGRILVGHTGAEGVVTAEQVEAGLESSYADDLAADAPLPAGDA